jgi:hypothetical protein
MRSVKRRISAVHAPLAPLALLLAVLVAPATHATRTADDAPSPGAKIVRFDGVSVQVPAAWPVYDLARDPQRCVRLDVHAVYLGTPGPNQQCPAHLVGRTEAVVLSPDHGPAASGPSSVTGEVARELPGHHVRVTATFGSAPDVARRITRSATADGSSAAPAPAVSPAAYSRAAAAPRTTTATSGVFIGNGFDTCSAPSEPAMQAWMNSSPYRAANIYIGGAERACGDGNLSATWVSHVRAMGWRLIPTYVGLQAPCTGFSHKVSSDPTVATTQGQQSADDAIARAQSFGLPAGSPVYFDMENYSRSAAGCSAAVLAFLGGWTNELHAQGWASGAYGSGSSLVTDLSAQWGTGYPEPDDLWFADWNNLDSAYGDPYAPDSAWTGHRRIHQWHGGVNERYGGVTINIDRDGVDGQVVGPAGGDCVTYPAEDYGPDGCDGALSLTGPLQYWRFGSPYGEQQSMRWTYGNGSSESNGATWAPPHLTAGVYDLSAWVPAQHSGATAHYTVTDTNGSHSVSISQSSAAGTWAALGEFSTGVTGTITAHVGDDTATSSVVGVDAMKFHFVHAIDQQPPTGTITTPASGSFARPGATVTLAGSFDDDVYVTKVVFSVADGSGDWQVVGTDTHNGTGTFSVNWPESYAEGAVVSVRAEIHDTADHVTTVTAPNVLTVDATPPVAWMTQPAALTPTTAKAQWLAWSGSDTGAGVSSYDLRGRWSTWTGWTSHWHRVGPTGGFTGTAARFGGMRVGWQYCFEVRAHDGAGNISRWSAQRCVARALDDRVLSPATGGWTRATSSRFFASTYTSTYAYNAKLTMPTVAASRIVLRATVCSTCGAVRAYIGGHYAATINLRSSRWRTHMFVFSRVFGQLKGALTLRVVTSQRFVRIDGIVLGRV